MTSATQAWLQAARPLAQVNILVPLLFGQAMAFAATGRVSLGWLWTGAQLGLLIQLVVVFANDFSDRDTDAGNATYARFSGGSRVLPEGRLAPASVRTAALVALAALTFVCVGLAFAGRPWLPGLAVATAVLVWLYDHPPLRLSYRGHGELVQGLGTGVVLPVAGFYLQAGGFAGFAWTALVPMFLLGAVGNIVSALPDHPSDLASGKRSYPVRRGQWAARRHALELVAIAAAASGLVLPVSAMGSVLLALPVLAVLGLAVPLLGSADAEHRAECERFGMIVAGAAHLLVLLWSVGFIVLGLRAHVGG